MRIQFLNSATSHGGETCNPSTHKVEVEFGAQDHLWFHSRCKPSLGNIRLCLKKPKQIIKSHKNKQTTIRKYQKVTENQFLKAYSQNCFKNTDVPEEWLSLTSVRSQESNGGAEEAPEPVFQLWASLGPVSLLLISHWNSLPLNITNIHQEPGEERWQQQEERGTGQEHKHSSIPTPRRPRTGPSRAESSLLPLSPQSRGENNGRCGRKFIEAKWKEWTLSDARL